jgi:hypothetical protein
VLKQLIICQLLVVELYASTQLVVVLKISNEFAGEAMALR